MWTVLLVEDEREALQYIRGIINWKDYGFVVVDEARNGAEALQKIRDIQPHVVFTDIIMPEMDGVELLKQARSTGYEGRFVMLTCMNEFEYARQALEYGASSYMLKLSMDQLTLVDVLAKITRELQEQHRHQQALSIMKHAGPQPNGRMTDHSGINRIIQYVQQHYPEVITLQLMAELVVMDASYLSDLFKKKTGVSLIHFVQQTRVDAAKLLLQTTDLTMREISEQVGFANENYFNKIFKRWTGDTPTVYKRNG
ncbi:response regulator [Paenibacillus sp. GCM10023252]|uniref:response regulator transcription factor n=1 Tax=Paenibacillus sp. GCM10023252 TaxID=3252649 RepID=UPI00361D514E